jgi:lysophospholipase L1-like esterase
VADAYADNLSAIVTILRDTYADPRIYVLNISDPTDGTGTIPPGGEYEGICVALETYGGTLGPTAVSNLDRFNGRIASAAASEGVELLDVHGWFDGHGLNSSDGWMSNDCAHPTDLGHNEIRRLAWQAWTGKLY